MRRREFLGLTAATLIAASSGHARAPEWPERAVKLILPCAPSGASTASHLRLEMLKLKASIDILHVPYRGNADALNDRLANNVQMMNEINPMPHVRAGKLTLLDISYPERPDFPDVPTLWEVGYGDAYVPSWYSIWAPAGTPRPIIEEMRRQRSEDTQRNAELTNLKIE